MDMKKYQPALVGVVLGTLALYGLSWYGSPAERAISAQSSSFYGNPRRNRRNPVSRRPLSGRWKLSYYGRGGKPVKTYHDSVAEAEAALAKKASAAGISASDRGHLWGSAEDGELAYGYPDGSVEVAYITAQRR